MKKVFAFVFVILLLNSCSDFSHMHYRKVKKVPASGVVLPHADWVEKNNNPVFENATHNDSVLVSTEKIIPQKVERGNLANEKSVQKKIFHEILKPDWRRENKKNINTTNPEIPKHKKFDGSTLLIIFFLLVGLGLIISGGIILVMGIFAPLWWMILLGLIMFLLGLFPFIGLLAFIFGSSAQKPPRSEYKEKQLH